MDYNYKAQLFKEMIPLRIVLVTLLIVCCCQCQPCTDPVSFNSPQFTIRGSCPNDTVLLVPVGDTVHYRCDYEDRSGGSYLPYWHITGLDGTPFLNNFEGMKHSLNIGGSDGVSGYTALSIPIKEQYLNTTLDIQCGLCSGPVCFGGDKLSENIISTSVKLVTFSKSSTICQQLFIVGKINNDPFTLKVPPLTCLLVLLLQRLQYY